MFSIGQINELHGLIREYGMAEWREGLEAAISDQSSAHELSIKISRDAFKAVKAQLKTMGLL